MALVHAGLGKDERVFECLHRAYAVRDVHLMCLTVDPQWDRYRGRLECDLDVCKLLARLPEHQVTDPERRVDLSSPGEGSH